MEIGRKTRRLGDKEKWHCCAGLVALSTKLPSKTSGQARQVRNGYGSFHERLWHCVREKKRQEDTETFEDKEKWYCRAGLVALSTKLPSKTSGQARQVRNGYGSFHERLWHCVREKKRQEDTETWRQGDKEKQKSYSVEDMIL